MEADEWKMTRSDCCLGRQPKPREKTQHGGNEAGFLGPPMTSASSISHTETSEKMEEMLLVTAPPGDRCVGGGSRLTDSRRTL